MEMEGMSSLNPPLPYAPPQFAELERGWVTKCDKYINVFCNIKYTNVF
jgi:hypothetical protein